MKRWLKAAIPFAVLATVVTGTLIVHAIETPDTDDPQFLTPRQRQEITGFTLAARLQADGITVHRAETTAEAVATMRRGSPATLFVTTPDLADLARIGRLPNGSRVVAVNPSAGTLRRSNWPVQATGSHWTTRVADPDCADPIARAAGPAAVRLTEYRTQPGATVCYQGALVTVRVDGYYWLTVVGSPDPFRDDRIAEHGNAALAVGLLSQNRRVVWLDVHERDRPTPQPTPAKTGIGGTDPTVSVRPTYTSGDGDGGQGTGRGDGSGADDGDVPQSEQRQQENDPLFDALPPALWATLLLLLLIMLALAAAYARRLGAPVAEPLPSRVPANETMLGHARLYERGRARAASLAILTTAARRRITTHLALPPGASVEDIAAQAGLPVRYVRDILDGHPPESDADLVEAATLLQNLVNDVTAPRHEGEQP